LNVRSCGKALRLLGAAVVLGLAVGGCASRVDELPPSLETLRLLREQGVPPLALGTFRAASPEIGRGVGIRLSVMKPPKGRSYPEFLGETFAIELKAAGKLDPAVGLRLEGGMTESRADEDMAKGSAALGARMRLGRAGQVLLDKPYRVETQWRSDFIGAIAIEEAFRRYNGLYGLLVRQVLSDPEFVAATRR
jgi:hypothetical protein